MNAVEPQVNISTRLPPDFAPVDDNKMSDSLLNRVNLYFGTLKNENIVKQLTLQIFTGLMLHSKVALANKKNLSESEIAKAQKLSDWLQEAKGAYEKIEGRKSLFSSNNGEGLQISSLILKEDYEKIDALFEKVELNTDSIEVYKEIHRAIDDQTVETELGNRVIQQKLRDTVNNLIAGIDSAQAQLEEIDIHQIYKSHAGPLKKYQSSCISNAIYRAFSLYSCIS
jgi:hypothetical protein